MLWYFKMAQESGMFFREADPFWDGETFGFLAITPGKSATKAMAVSCIMFHHEKMSPTPERLERMAPVCTQMKL